VDYKKDLTKLIETNCSSSWAKVTLKEIFWM
jgi:hypothetical protein